MYSKFLLGILIFLIGLGGYSQNKVTGVIVDEESGQPVSDAYIMLVNGNVQVSDSMGQFTISVDKMPVTLRITHISYGQSDITLEQWPDGILIIRVQKMISDIQEVQISAERMRILTEKNDFSLQDFAIDSTHIWMLGYLNNRPSRGRLWIASLFGDTLLSIPVKKPEKLYRDIFGNVHLFINDSAYQLFGGSDTIGFVDVISRDDFQRIIYPIKAYYAGKLIYQNYIPRQEGLHTYYYSIDDPEPKFISCIRDTTAEILQEDEYIYGKAGSAVNSLTGSSGSSALAAWLAMVKRKQNASNVVYRKISAPLAATKDKLYILNLFKDSLLIYDSSGTFSKAKPISFHRGLELFKGIDYKDINLFSDPGSGRIYNLERQNTAWILSSLDTETGNLENIPLPDYPGMTGITVINNAVYFLYPEKKYPYFSRLYRYQL